MIQMNIDECGAPIDWGGKIVFEWREEYLAEKAPIYEKLIARLLHLVKALLDARSIPYHLVEARVKSVDRYISKIRRKLTPENRDDFNPYEEIIDIAGLRVILFFEDDVERVLKLIEDEFDASNPEKGKTTKDPKVFDYDHSKRVIRINGARSKLIEWQASTDLQAEIQVRTVLGHAWATVSHRLHYGTAKKYLDKDYLHTLHGCIPKLEGVDKEFVDLRTQYQEMKAQAENNVKNTNYGIPIDIISLGTYLQESLSVLKIADIANSYGFSPYPTVARRLYELHDICKGLGIMSLSSLDELLQSHLNNYPDFFNLLAERLPVKHRSNGFFVLAILIALKRQEMIKKLHINSILQQWSIETVQAIYEAGPASGLSPGPAM